VPVPSRRSPVESAVGADDGARPLARAWRIGCSVVARLASIGVPTVALRRSQSRRGRIAGPTMARRVDHDPPAYAAKRRRPRGRTAASRGQGRAHAPPRQIIELFGVQPEGSDQLCPPVWPARADD
jgi:hypothetical protein